MAGPSPVLFSPDERDEMSREDAHPETLPSINAEIARTQQPEARAVLEGERARVEAVQAAAKPRAAPPTWDEVTKLPEMEALPFDQLEAARHQYFVDVVAPQVRTDDLDAARSAFDADTKPGVLNQAISRLNDLLPKKPATPGPALGDEFDAVSGAPVSEEDAAANRERLGKAARMTATRTGQPVLEGGRVVPPAGPGEGGKETAPLMESVKAAPKIFQLGTVQAIPQIARQYQDLDQRIQDATVARDALAKRAAAGEEYVAPDYNVRMEVGPRSPALSEQEKLDQARVFHTPADSLGSYEAEVKGLDAQIAALTEQRNHYAKVSELVGKDLQKATPKDQGMGGKMVTTAAQSAGPMILGAATRSPVVGAVPGTAVQGAQAFEQTLTAGEDAKKRLPEFKAAPDKLKYIQSIAGNEDADDTTRKAAGNVLQAIRDNAEARAGGVLSSEAEARENAAAVEKFGQDLTRIAENATIRSAKLGAAIQMAAEFGGERVGLGAILKPGSKLMPKLVESIATNFGQEFVTQGVQTLEQILRYDPTITLKDALEQMVIAGGAGAVTAGPLTVGAHLIEKGVEAARPRAERRQPPPGAAPGPGEGGKKPAPEMPTVSELLAGAPVPTEEEAPRGAPAEEPDRISTINALLGTVATSLSRAQEAGDERQIAHYQGRAKELIEERAQLERAQNPDVDAQALQRQNRDRTRAASIAQMQSIANAPDYDRLATAPIPDVGAPMVSVKGDEPLPAGDLGKAAVVTLADGTKIPVRYAVVEAESVLASNDVNGKQNAEYFGDIPKGQLVAMTNGRVAGVQGAYARGTAQPYVDGMAADPEHGVSAEAIKAKKRPMLVRVYDDAYNSLPRLAQLSNTGGSAQLSDTEKARNDAAALDSLDGFAPTESGDVTAAANMPFVRRFMQSIPENERPEMLTAAGELSQAGTKRLRAAVFAKAYGGGDALQRMVESTDDNVRSLTAGLMRAAPAVARLREKVAAGALHDLDITPQLLRAVEDFARLKADGLSVGAWLAQADMFGALPEEIVALMGFLEDNARSGRRIAEFLERYLAAAEALGNPAQGGMFETTTPGKAALVRGVTKEIADERRAEGLREGARPAVAPAGGTAQASEGAGAAAVSGARQPGEQGADAEGGERAQVDTALTETKQEFASTQVALPREISDRVMRAAKKLIAPADVDQEHGLEDRPHITIKYGLHTPDVAAVQEIARSTGPVQAKILGLEIFEPEGKDYDVVVARVDSSDLSHLNKAIAEAIPNTDTHPDYKPHITLGYVKRGTGKKYADAKTGLEGQTIKMDTIEVSDQNENVTEVKLTGKPEDRRSDVGRRKAISAMSQEEMRRELLIDSLTGLGNRRAYDESEKQAVQVSLDLDALKWINDNIGHEAGDRIIRAIGQAVGDETQNGYHLSGDEFAIQASSEEEAGAIVEALRDRLSKAELVFRTREGRDITKRGVDFSHGIGSTLEDADDALRASKAEREASGERARRGEAPAGVTVRSAEGGAAAASEVTAQAENRTALAPAQAPQKPYAERLRDVLIDNDPNPRIPLQLSDTPATLRLIGLEQRPLQLTTDVAQKVFFDHGVPRSVIERLPELIADPVMIFESDTVPGTYVVLTSEIVKDLPLVVAIKPDTAVGRVVVHLVASAYPRVKPKEALGRWLKDGLLRYVHTQKRLEWQRSSGLQLPGEVPIRGAGNRVLTQSDLVKFQGGEGGGAPSDSGTPLSRRRGGASGMALADVNAAVDALRPALKGLPAVNVRQSVADAPEALRADIARLGGERDTAGAWHAGEIWLFAENLESRAHAQWALLHEATHQGLRAILGSTRAQVMADLYARNAALRQLANQQRGINPRLSLAAATEEALANMGANGVPESVMRRLVAAVRRGLRAVGVQLRLTDADVQDLIARALRSVKKPPRGTQLLRASSSPNSLSEARDSDTALARTTGAPEAPRGRGSLLSHPAVAAGYRAWARKAVDTLDGWLDPISSLPKREEYLVERYKTLGVISKADELAAGIRAAFEGASDEDKQAVYDYLVTAGATPEGIKNAATRANAVKVKAEIGKVGDGLVERGMLSEESREAYRDGYLPRLYLKHLLSEGDFSALGAGKKPSNMGYLKQRKDIPEDVRRVILGEITDPGYLAAVAVAKPLRDMVLLDWLANISQKTEWVLPGVMVKWGGANLVKPAAFPEQFGKKLPERLVSAYWLKEEAARLRKQSEHQDKATAAKAIELATEMERAANKSLEGMPQDRKQYKQIPDTARYGHMRGLWVRREIYDDLMGVNDFIPADPGIFQSLFGYGGVGTRITQVWKTLKVALNLPSQVRNGVSNFVQLNLSGVALPMAPVRVIQAAREIFEDGTHWKIAKKYGVKASTFSSQELYRAKRELLALERDTKGLSPFAAMHHIAAKIMELGGDAYQFSESVFKTAKIIDMMTKGETEQKAMLEAQKWLYDYSLVHRNVRYLRNAPIGVPFLTFLAKSAPRMAEVALLHPWRFLPYAAVLYGMAYAVAAMYDVDKDDLDKLKKALSEWLQDRGHTMLLPFKDANGRWQVLDLGYFFPWTQFTEIAHNIKEGELGKAVKSAGIFSGPLTDLLVAIKTGKDSFTSRDIYKPGDPPTRQAISIMNYLWTMAAPPMITDMGFVGHAARAYTGETNKYGDPVSTPSQAALRLFGVNVYAMEPEQTRAANIRKQEFEIGEVKQAAKQRLMDRSLTDTRRAEVIEEYRTEAERRQQRLLKYIQESGIHPNLETGR